MVRPVKTKQIPRLQEAIKATAWKQIAVFGAPTLSLRAIARELTITAPAIYHYFPDRDALVTALVIDAYTSFGDWQIAARDAVPEHQLSERLVAIGYAYREWALAHPERYQLIFGTPIPGYEAPMSDVLPSAARSLSALVSVIDQLRRAGRLMAAGYPTVNPEYAAQFDIWKTYAGDYDILALSVAMLVWSRVHGLVSLEIAHTMPPFGIDGAALYRYELHSIVHQFIQGA